MDTVQQVKTALRAGEAPANESVVGAIQEFMTAVQQSTAAMRQYTTVQQEILTEVRKVRIQVGEPPEDARQLPSAVLSGVGRVFAEALAEERRQAQPSAFSAHR